MGNSTWSYMYLLFEPVLGKNMTLQTLFCALRNSLAVSQRTELQFTESYGGKHIAFR